MTLDERIKRFRRTFPRPIKETAHNVLRTLIFDLIDDREDLKTLDKIQVEISESEENWNDAFNTQPEEPGLYLAVQIYPSPHVNIVLYMEHGGFVNHVAAWKPLPDIPIYVKQWLQDMVSGKGDYHDKS